MADTTFPKLLQAQAQQWGTMRIAIREKDYGIWHEVTWQGYFERVKYFALGLKALGFGRGEHACIIGHNEPEWVYAELAVQALGGVAIGIYPDSTPDEVHYIVERSDAVYVIAEDQEQTDKILEIQEALPLLRRIIYWDPRGMRNYREPILSSFEAIQTKGKTFASEQPNLFDEEIAKGQSDDIALILTTSGTTSRPKLAMLTHRNMLKMGENLLVKLDTMSHTDEFVSFLPLPWVGEQMTCISGALLVGFTVNFPEEPTTAREDIREIAPHVMFSPPSIWEGMLSSIQVKIEDASWLKKRLYHLLMPYGQQMADARFTGDEPGRWDRLRYRLAHNLMFRALKDRMGLARIRTAYSGGAALGPDVFKFFHALGVNLKQIYGQTEISGISVVHRDDDIKFDTVGLPIAETEIKIAKNGEILSRSPSVFQGYYRDSEATASALKDGWLYSGDAGYMDDDGHLVVIDRLKDVMHLSNGTMFSPQFIENKLKFSQYIREAVVFGNNREHVTAFINIEYQNVARWAERHHIAFTTYTDLSQKPEVYDWIRDRVRVVNTQLPAAARIRRFVILHKELDADDQELTRTKKVRRGFIEDKYTDLVEALYSTVDQVSVEANVRYRDGRKEVIQTFVRVETMETE